MHSYKLGLQKIKRGSEIASSKINEDEAIKICELLQNGFNCREVSESLDISKSIVSNIRKRADWIHISKRYEWVKGKDRKYQPELIKKIYLMILNECSTKKICKEINMSGKKIVNLINKLKHKKCYKDIIKECEKEEGSTTIEIRKIKIRRVE